MYTIKAQELMPQMRFCYRYSVMTEQKKYGKIEQIRYIRPKVSKPYMAIDYTDITNGVFRYAGATFYPQDEVEILEDGDLIELKKKIGNLFDVGIRWRY